MRHWRSALLATLLLAPGAALASGGPFGAGIILGEPSGLSMKLFLDGRHAVDGALDFSFIDDAIYVHADYLWHFTPLGSRRAGRHVFLPYAGVGGRITVRDDDHKHRDGGLGVRVPLGIAWIPGGAPIDIFLELVPGLSLTPETDPDLDAGLGVRYFF